MRSIVSPEFRRSFAHLPLDVQDQARRAYRLWLQDPNHPGLNFKRLKPHAVHSVRVGIGYRAICAEVEPGIFVWDWIGSHGDYDKLVKNL